MNNKIILTTLSPKSHRTSEENLGIGYLTSYLRKYGYVVEIIDAWLGELSIEDVYQKIISNDNILFVGISSYMSNTIPTIDLINKLKAHNNEIKIVTGGFGPTFYPDDYLNNGVDIVVRGEGEITIKQIADALCNNQSINSIDGISYKDENGNIIHNQNRCLANDLDEFPMPARDTMNIVLDKKSTVNVLTARGCSGQCEFCSVIAFFKQGNGKLWRSRSIQNIVEELSYLQSKGVTYIKVVDDSFVDGYRDEEWCKTFADEIIKRGIRVRLRGQIRADKVTDNILKYLKQAGFYSFACGIENGSETALRRMNKKATLLENRRALELFKKYNYIVQMGYILFDKDTTIEELEENYRFLNEFDWTVTKGIFSEMYSAEGTNLTNKLKVSGELIGSDFINNNNKYELSNSKVKSVYEGLKKWHKSHSSTYDMAIDPLSSPKALSHERLLEFYELAMELKCKDLELFRAILDRVNDSGKIVEFVVNEINNIQQFYNEIDEKVKKLYKKNNIIYKADINPFI